MGKKSGKRFQLILFLLVFSSMTLANTETLCSYDGPYTSDDEMRHYDFLVEGPSELGDGSEITVEFYIKNVGNEPINLTDKGIFAAARDKDENNNDFGFIEKETLLQPGEEVHFRKKFTLDERGLWSIWPSYEYWETTYSAILDAYITLRVKGPDYWWGCDLTACADYCEDDVLHYDAYLGQGNECVYEEEECEYGCDKEGKACAEEPEEDTSAPVLSILVTPTQPKAGDEFSISVTATDKSGIASIVILVGGKMVGMCDTSPCRFTGTAAENNPQVGALGTDIFGNLGETGNLPWEEMGPCRDTDDGIFANAPGQVTNETSRIEGDTIILPPVYFDTCINSTHIVEYYCEGSEVRNVTLGCGVCTEGPKMLLEDGSIIPVGGDFCECEDSDYGKNYYVFGVITTPDGLVPDACSDFMHLVEHYCDENGEAAQETYLCPGGCSEGVCLCRDTDGGKAYYVQGTAGNETDECTSPTRLTEYFCSSDGIGVEENIRCPCEDGACICMESDRGRNYYRKGSIVWDPHERVDECIDSRQLREYYCDGNEVQEETIYCFSCRNGACECTDSDYGVNYYLQGTLSSGDTDYCINNETLREFFNRLEGENECNRYYVDVECPDGCVSGACRESCFDGIQNQDELGIDCGGSCTSVCTNCFVASPPPYEIAGYCLPGNAEDAGYFDLEDPAVGDTAYRALMEYANCLTNPSCREGLPTLNPLENYSDIDADALQYDTNYIMEAAAWYVNEHMRYMYDGDDDSVQGAAYTITESGSRSGKIMNYTTDEKVHVDQCPNDFCGDCEDHAILREAIMRRLGIRWECAFCADHYNGYWGGGHVFNIVNYKNKYRIMDYGALGSDFDRGRWSQHRPQNLFNDWIGVYNCPDWKDNLGDGSYDCGCDKTRPKHYTWNYPGEEVQCPSRWVGEETYHTDICP